MGSESEFWNSSFADLKRGYMESERCFTCLLCQKDIEKGIIYPHMDVLYEAEKFMQLHIEEAHQSVFTYLIGLDKKLTGLTDHQNRLLQHFYQGSSDKDIQADMGIGSASTIRNHRFVLKEKERQARLFLVLMELLKEKDDHPHTFIPVHKHATMIDDRYNITEAESEKVLQKFFPDGLTGRLKSFPPKEKQRLIILRAIAAKVDVGTMYDEKSINGLLAEIYDDYAILRRYLVEYGFIDRKADGSAYWLKN